MITRVAWLFVALLPGQELAALPNPPKVDSDPWNADPPPDPTKPETLAFSDRGTYGFVQSIDKDGITLFRPELEILHWRHDPQTGESFGVQKREKFPTIPPKKFLLVEELAKGEYIKTATGSDTYRITDVRVGDRVLIDYCRRNGADICKTICIQRRPGGQVPPAPGEKPDAFRKYHERANADQDWEEKRSAYPRKYWSSYMGNDGKIYEGPYPSGSIQIIPILPTAPAPREVKSDYSPTNP